MFDLNVMLMFLIIMFRKISSLKPPEKEFFTPCGIELYSDDLGCYDNITDDFLKQITKKDQKDLEDSIFFIQMACSGGLDFKHACSVESAARAHPHRQVTVFFVGPVSMQCFKAWPIWQMLLKYHNIKMYRLNITNHLRDTIIAGFVTEDPFNASPYPREHLADILKFVTLYKYGGVYLDLNIIIMKTLNSLEQNWLVKRDDEELSVDVMALSNSGLGQTLSYNFLRHFKDDYNPKFEDQGIISLSAVVQELCNTRDFFEMFKEVCGGLQIYDKKLFYPIGSQLNSESVQSINEKMYKPNWNEAYGFYIWNGVPLNPFVDNQIVRERLMEKYCPDIYVSLVD